MIHNTIESTNNYSRIRRYKRGILGKKLISDYMIVKVPKEDQGILATFLKFYSRFGMNAYPWTDMYYLGYEHRAEYLVESEHTRYNNILFSAGGAMSIASYYHPDSEDKVRSNLRTAISSGLSVIKDPKEEILNRIRNRQIDYLRFVSDEQLEVIYNDFNREFSMARVRNFLNDFANNGSPWYMFNIPLGYQWLVFDIESATSTHPVQLRIREIRTTQNYYPTSYTDVVAEQQWEEEP